MADQLQEQEWVHESQQESSMKFRIIPVSLAAVVLATILVPVVVSSPVQAQSQTGWYVNDNPTLHGPAAGWQRGQSGHGYGSNNYVYTYAIGGASLPENSAEWSMGNRIGRQEVQVYVPSRNAAATVEYHIEVGTVSTGAFTQIVWVNQSNVSGWHRLRTVDANGKQVTIRLLDSEAQQHYERDGIALSSIGVDAVAMRCVENCPEPPGVSPPDAPRNLRLTRIDADSFRIQWDPPSSDGGAAITRYRATISRPAISTSIPAWQNSYTYSSNARSHRFDGRLDATYTVRLVAINRVGASSTTTARHQTDRPTDRDSSTVPTALRNLRLTRVDADSFRITWDPPSSNGGARITGYRATLSRPALSSSIPAWERTYSYSRTDRSRTFNGRPGATYTVRLAATNRVGTGPSLSARYTIPVTVLGRVVDFGITRVLDDNNSFRIAWDPPANDGGAAITGYIVRVSRPRFDGSGTRTWTYNRDSRTHTMVFDGNTEVETTYTVTVAARNRVGTGPAVSARITTAPDRALCDRSWWENIFGACAAAPGS